MTIKGLEFDLNIKTDKAKRSLKDMVKQFQKLQDALSSGTGYKNLQNLTTEVSKLDTALTSLNRQLNKFVKSFSKMSTEIEKSKPSLKNLSNIVKNVNKNTSNATESVETLGSAVKKTGDDSKKTNITLKNIGKTISYMYRGALFGLLAGTVLKLTQAFTGMIDIGTQFEYVMASVRAVTNATDAEFKKLVANAEELGRTTMFTAVEVAKLSENYGRLGFSVDEILKASAATVLLASATGEDLATSADVAGAIIRSFNKDASETPEVVDLMAKAFSSSALTLERFSESMKFVAPVANAANISLEETTSILALLADSGIRGSLAGTALKNIFGQMRDEGSSLTDVLGRTTKGFDDLINALQEASKDSDFADRALAKLDKRVTASVIVLSKNTDKLRELNKEMQNYAGSAQAMADIRMDALQGDVLKLKSAWEGVAISVEQGLSPVLRLLTQSLTSMLRLSAKDTLEALSNEASAAEARFSRLVSTYEELEAVIEKTEYQTIRYNESVKALKDEFPEYFEFLNKVTQGYIEEAEAKQKTISALREEARLRILQAKIKEKTTAKKEIEDETKILLLQEQQRLNELEGLNAQALREGRIEKIVDLEKAQDIQLLSIKNKLASFPELLRAVNEELKDANSELEQFENKQKINESASLSIFELAQKAGLEYENQSIALTDVAKELEKQITPIKELVAQRNKYNQAIKDGNEELAKTLKLTALESKRVALYEKEAREREKIENDARKRREKIAKDERAYLSELVQEKIKEEEKYERESVKIAEKASLSIQRIREKKFSSAYQQIEKEMQLQDRAYIRGIISYQEYVNRIESLQVEKNRVLAEEETKLATKRIAEWQKIHYVISGIIQSTTSAFASGLNAMFHGSESFATKFKNLWKGIADAILALITKMIAQWLVFQALTNVFGLGGGLADGLLGTAFAEQGGSVNNLPLKKYGNGGMLGGRSHSNGGTIIEAEKDEYVINKKRVNALGQGFFDFINFGNLKDVMSFMSGFKAPKTPKYSTSGVYESGGSVSAGIGDLHLSINVDPLTPKQVHRMSLKGASQTKFALT